MMFSIIAQVIIEMRRSDWSRITSFLAIINHPARGDYNTEALILKMAAARFFMFLKKKQVK